MKINTKIATFSIVGACIVAALGYGAYSLEQNRTNSAKAANAAKRDVPVTVAKSIASKGSIPAVISSVGSASAQAFAVVKPRVDGLLVQFLAAEGSIVTAGQPLAQIDPTPFEAALAQAQGSLARDQAQWANAASELDRSRKLYEREAISRQQLESLESNAKQLEATVAIDKASLRTAELNRSWTTVRAPISGRLGIRAADPGNMVRSSDAAGLASISSNDGMGATFSVPADSARLIEVGSKVAAYERLGGRLLGEGLIAAIDNQIDAATGTLKARAKFSAKDQSRFIANEFLQIKTYGRATDGIVIPTAAIAMSSSGALAWRIDPESMTAKPVKIKIIAQNDEQAVVEGLPEGSLLAADSLDKLKEGTKVKFAETLTQIDAPARERKGPGKGNRPDKTGAAKP